MVVGDEDNAYDIVNGSVPLIMNQVEAGVLGRVVAELLSIDVSSNKVYLCLLPTTQYGFLRTEMYFKHG